MAKVASCERGLFFPGQTVLLTGQPVGSQTCQGCRADVAALSQAVSFNLNSLLSHFLGCPWEFLALLPTWGDKSGVCPFLCGSCWGCVGAGDNAPVPPGGLVPLLMQTLLSLSPQHWPNPDFQTSPTILPAWRAVIIS